MPVSRAIQRRVAQGPPLSSCGRAGIALSSGLLIVLNDTRQVSFFVMSHSGAENEVAMWIEAAQLAFDKVGKENSYDLWAVVSQNHESPTSPPLRLTDRLTLDGIVVEPAGFYSEFVTPRFQMHVWLPSVSQLILVKFKTRAYDSYAASQLAARQARHLTGVSRP